MKTAVDVETQCAMCGRVADAQGKYRGTALAVEFITYNHEVCPECLCKVRRNLCRCAWRKRIWAACLGAALASLVSYSYAEGTGAVPPGPATAVHDTGVVMDEMVMDVLCVNGNYLTDEHGIKRCLITDRWYDEPQPTP